jgi:formate dehydrogenase assembly factor FdhD
MPDPMLCTRCGSDSVIPRLRVVERGDGNQRYDLEVEVQRRPNAVLFKRAERTKLFARVCGACGHAELYADAPRALHAAYLQAEASPTVSALEELERTREALADSQIRLRELEDKLAFVEQMLEPGKPQAALPEKS